MILPDLKFENSLRQKKFKHIVGIDEVGRGSWAGPLVAAGVILPINCKIPSGLADSKLLTATKRKRIAQEIRNVSLGVYIAQISSDKITKVGLSKATNLVFREIARKIRPKADFCLIDAFYIKYFSRKKQLAIKHGDAICASIAAASIIAKVYRDELMEKLGFKYPKYNFAKNKGYGTLEHQNAISRYGYTKIHRTSYNLNFLFS